MASAAGRTAMLVAIALLAVATAQVSGNLAPPGEGDGHGHQHDAEAQKVYEAEMKAARNFSDPRARQVAERAAFLKLHKGHEMMHLEMILVMFITLILAQVLLVAWKANYFNSFQTVTLAGMWIMPAGFSFYHSYTRFCVVWVLFTIMTIFVTFKATRKPMPTSTPRFVYTYFLVVAKITGFMGIAGYFIALADFLVGPYLPQPTNQTLMSLGLLTLYYGLYFGVLGRDLADISARQMASAVGYYSSDGISTKQLRPDTCAVCNGSLKEAQEHGEKAHTLSCNHSFHEFCIRGWCIVGKKDMCPYCKEKVNLKELFPSALQRTDVMYAQLLDALRYLVVWYPAIMTVVKGVNWALGLK